MFKSAAERSASDERNERGQVLVIVAICLVVLVAMVGVVIDGGLAWGRQRDTQNAADAAAKAGAGVLAENVAGVSPARTDADIFVAMQDTATSNDLGEVIGYYTDVDGNLLTSAGGIAADTDAAAVVGDGVIPPGTYGVRADGIETFDTLLARVIGIPTFTVRAPATAVSGYLVATCPASAGCSVLPVTLPITILGCDGSNDPAYVVPSQQWQLETFYTLPLCKTGPGNVGWLDWNPNEQTEGCSGTGTAEIACIIEQPSNPALEWPMWYEIASTGNINSGQVEDAINDNYAGEVVLIPLFDVTCDAQPTGPGGEDCPAGHEGGHGQNQWYHLAGMASLRLCGPAIAECGSVTKGAYIQGNNEVPCDTGNGATSCLAGLFEKIVEEGKVTANPPPSQALGVVGVQLIR